MKFFISNPGGGGGASGTASITGGTATGLTSLGIRSTGAAFDLTLATSEVLTAGRTLSFNVGDAARTLTLSGNPTLSGVTITGAGTIATGGFTLTVGATGTAALLSTANVFTAAQRVSLGIAQNTPNLKVTAAATPTGLDTRYSYLHLGGTEFAAPGYYLMTFGYANATAPAAFVGYSMTSTSGNTKGDLIFGTRDVTTDTSPTTRLTILASGELQFGTHAAVGAETVTGYITIKDSGGTTRKLAVIS